VKRKDEEKDTVDKETRQLQVDEEELTEENNPYAFNVTVEKHDPFEIDLKMHFKKPNQISIGSAKDRLIMRVLEVSLFKSAKTLKSMSKDSFEEGDSMIVKSVPPIMDPVAAKKLTSTVDDGGTFMNAV